MKCLFCGRKLIDLSKEQSISSITLLRSSCEFSLYSDSTSLLYYACTKRKIVIVDTLFWGDHLERIPRLTKYFGKYEQVKYDSTKHKRGFDITVRYEDGFTFD